ncbi:hypothetical protein EBQ25_11165 [Allofranklinella schreckenbergeri]|uniref:Uncharacterized protein n=1 Tax=Allofranklinella schreckenbergeri TaxID=1076744 RepID=A0A3M6PZ18_9BURK|nr:hypothetical protein [Allofranklinella schreckenbergeri]RMW96209.1 hypothetical protein EBQ25_11165 [Allofranklinella schreckenbergeri]
MQSQSLFSLGRKAVLLAVLAGAAAGVQARDVVHSFQYDKGRVDVYVGTGQTLFVQTPVSTYDTGYRRASKPSKDCAYLSRSGACTTHAAAMADVEGKTLSGAYWK